MADSDEACDTVDSRPVIVAIALFAVASVNSDANSQLSRCRPRLIRNELLDLNGCSGGLFCGAEGGMECIAHRLDDVPSVAFDCGAEQFVVTAEREGHLLGVLFP